jgi:hypothetical protein
MSIGRFRETLANGNKRLHVAPRSNDVDGNIETRDSGILGQQILKTGITIPILARFGVSLCGSPRSLLVKGLRQLLRLLTDQDVDPAVASDLSLEIRSLGRDVHAPDI